MRAAPSPSAVRSRTSLAFTAAAAEGRLSLQRCRTCNGVCYPARDACPRCWSLDLRWVDIPDGGALLTESTLYSSFNPYFQARLPWRVGTVRLDAGPVVLAHIHGAVPDRGRVRMIARTDNSGQGVLMALPDREVPNVTEDRQLRTLTCDPRDRNVLITDASGAVGRAVAEAVAAAGAARVYAGIVGDGKSASDRERLEAIPGVEPVALDADDDGSIAGLSAAIGGNTDILIHTACLVRPGAAIGSPDIASARDEMEVNYFRLLRLIRGFGPTLRDRVPDADTGLRAWVNLLSVYALSGGGACGTSAASQAAAWSLSRALRAELAGSGVKVINVLSGPLDDAWNRSLPLPKAKPSQVAAATVAALQEGLENVAVGPVAEDILQRYREDRMALERDSGRP